MKCLRPTGLVIVLVTLPIAVHLASLETTSRYTSGDNIRFPLKLSQNIINDLTQSNISSQATFKYELEDTFDENYVQNNRTDRKVSKLSSIKRNNITKHTVSSSKTRTNTKSVTTSPPIIKSSIIRKNSHLVLNNTQKISFVATKAPITSRLTTKTTLPPSNSFKINTPVKINKSTTTRIKVKPTIKRIRPLNGLVKSSSTTRRPIKKPTIHKILTKWSDNVGGENKQNWYEEGVPYPNPNPEISSASPGVFLSSLSPISPISSTSFDTSNALSGPTPQPEITSYSPNYSINNGASSTPDLIDLVSPVPSSPDNVVNYQPLPESSQPQNPISVFNLDMVPDGTKAASGLSSPCPSVHISSQVMNPLGRQGCSDLNLVINSHIHQNGGNRNPISTYDGLPPTGAAEEVLAEPVAEDALAEDALAQDAFADPVAADPVAADPGVPAAASPGTGGSGGSGGSGGDGSGGPWQFPDLKHMFEAIGYVWNGLGSPPEQGVTQKRLTKKLLNVNTTSADVLDVRTPPKFKVQQKPKTKPSDEIENSHAGVAIPVDADTLELEATTKKLNFYKYERPTTNSGLSTWILLSGQSSTLKPTTKKPVIKPILEGKDNAQPKENSTLVLDPKPNRIVKPIFKKKLSSTTTSTSTTTTTTSTTTTTTSTTQRPVASTSPKSIKESTKLTKIKASDLNNALNKKNITTSTTTRPVKPSSVTTTKPTTVGTPTTTSPSNVTSIETKTQNNTVSSSSLPVEAKNQEIELEGSAESKKKPANPKRKKNKNRRKKLEKVDTNVAKPIKNKNNNPISSQIYSYLAKEIMPTVGAGIVGLMVTAGLATYFLYPFGAARRSDTDIDRRDKEGSYYYSDDYSSGMPEEEAIGKVIAGMPVNTLLSNNYKSPSNRKNYPVNTGKYRIADRRANVQPQKYEGFVKGSVENVPLGPDDYQPYKNKVDRKFVVGNVPKEVNEVTPVTVPEHGPRNLKLQKISNSDTDLAPAYGPRNLRRRKRDLSEDFTEDPGQLDPKRRLQRSGISNELDSEDLPPDVDKTSEDTKEDKDVTTITPNTTVTEVSQETTTVSSTESVQNFFDNIKYVLFLKARLALEVLRNATSLFSSYISNVQSKVENKYRNFIRRYESIS